MSEDLRKLRALLDTAIDSILDVCERRSQDFPRLNSPADPAELTPEGIRNDPIIAEAIVLGVSAASQLIATLQAPAASINAWNGKALVSPNINAVNRLHVPEILVAAGENGMHVSEIAKQCGTNAPKLARVLRHLATYHVFQETAPDVFAHNLVSSALDSGKTFEEVKTNPEAKFELGLFNAWASAFADDNLKVAVNMDKNLLDPEFAHSQEPNQTTFHKAFDDNRGLTWWQWYELPQHQWRQKRFNAAMKGISTLQPPSAVVELFDWTKLPKGALMVDIGAGLGHVTLEVAKVRPDLNFVLEDVPSVIEAAKSFWSNNAPGLANNVQFFALDYLNPQPRLEASPDVFLLRYICHNWADKYATILLKNLRDIAKPETQLLAMDCIVEYACKLPDSPEYHVEGYEAAIAPEPLLPNMGAAAAATYDMDILMLNNLNSLERTIKDWQHLFATSGWKLTAVHRAKGATQRAWLPMLIAKPA